MAVQWFYGASHARLGPFSAKQLKELKLLGTLQPTDMVWKEGVKKGLPASDICGLFGSTPAKAVVTETVNLPMLNAVLKKAVVLPVATDIQVAVKELARETVAEGLELKPIPEECVLALPATDAPLELENASVPSEEGLEPLQEETCATGPKPKDLVAPGPEQPRAKPAPVRMRRAIVESGAILISQDGERVRFRKKCVRCGYEETSSTVMRLMPGVNRQLFFCPKCRKQVGVSIRAV